ncbi:MAG: hypothetical protein KAV99_08055 [Candidatus Latescibacteria bacterium]|nr:hypothetical protein [Candidatus Latescibacterota bacterium]
MDVQNDSQKFSRSPTLDDLVDLCKHLNNAGVRYIIIGGFALIHHGFVRGTGDIDLLVDPSQENMKRIKQALLYLPDQAVREVNPSDIARYTVVRIADEIVIDLLGKACEVTYEMAQGHVEYDIVAGVRIPYPQVLLLIQTKQGIRPRDQQDRVFLQQLLKLYQKEK